MRKILEKAFATYDALVTKGANAVVGAYNWTTGNTKSDLANKMLSGAAILETTGFVNKSILTLPISFLFMWNIHFYQNLNKDVEEREVSALERSAKDLFVERYKNMVHVNALIWTPNMAFWSTGHSQHGTILSDTTFTDYLMVLGNALRASSFYVMKADYLPPRKNCFRRGYEKLTELVEIAYAEPAFVSVRSHQLSDNGGKR